MSLKIFYPNEEERGYVETFLFAKSETRKNK